ncbi:MAG: hypothetical protein HZB26_22515 [Candidatus Hydrogenedentes bacterium]|nr:hypothetical protein [Candidatus Hydrogenedentota bacterium]
MLHILALLLPCIALSAHPWNAPYARIDYGFYFLNYLDQLYGFPLCICFLTLTAYRSRRDLRYWAIGLPLLPIAVVTFPLRIALPGVVSGLMGIGEDELQRLLVIYAMSEVFVFLTLDRLANFRPLQSGILLVLVMLIAGLVGLIGYQYPLYGAAEHLTFVLVTTAAVYCAGLSCSYPFRFRRFAVWLFFWDVLVMLVAWPLVWLVLMLLVFRESDTDIAAYLPLHLLIGLVDGVGLFFILHAPFLVLVRYSRLYGERFRKLLRRDDKGDSENKTLLLQTQDGADQGGRQVQ